MNPQLRIGNGIYPPSLPWVVGTTIPFAFAIAGMITEFAPDACRAAGRSSRGSSKSPDSSEVVGLLAGWGAMLWTPSRCGPSMVVNTAFCIRYGQERRGVLRKWKVTWLSRLLCGDLDGHHSQGGVPSVHSFAQSTVGSGRGVSRSHRRYGFSSPRLNDMSQGS